MRTTLTRAATRLILARGQPPSVGELTAPAVVFAPHPDDETLGCGGTIALKRQAGADVRVVFLTDGERSHDRLVSSAELGALRRREATLAAAELDVPARNLEFCGFPDGALGAARDRATAQIGEILRRHEPAQVFVPHLADGPVDHRATTEFVLDAVKRAGFPTRIYEYPVWLWNSFPWVPWPAGRAPSTELARSWQAQRALLGAGLGRRGRVVPVAGVLQKKRQALARYTSQTQRLFGAEHRTLYDVSDGHWMLQLLGEHEIFRRTGTPCST